MIEILRRLLLIAGLCTAAWYWFDSPERLISVRRPDFAQEYARKYGQRKYAFKGAMEMGREFIRKNTNPGDAARFRERTLNSRYINPPPNDLSAWVDEIDSALQGRGSAAPRAAMRQVFYLPHEPPVDLFVPGLLGFYRGASWLNAYSTVANRDLEFWYHPEPRDSDAPQWILYPQRGSAWMWALGALAIYLLLPRTARGVSVRHDPIPIAVLDFAGAAIATFFWALPLFIHDSNRQAVNDIFGGAGLSWFVSALVVPVLMNNAARAAFGITATAGGLRVARLMGSREVPFGQLAAVSPLDDGAERIGIQLRLTTGEAVDLKWSGLMNFSGLLDALWRAGYYRPSHHGFAGTSPQGFGDTSP